MKRIIILLMLFMVACGGAPDETEKEGMEGPNVTENGTQEIDFPVQPMAHPLIITVRDENSDALVAEVRLYFTNGTFTGFGKTTSPDGIAEFMIPDENYRDYFYANVTKIVGSTEYSMNSLSFRVPDKPALDLVLDTSPAPPENVTAHECPPSCDDSDACTLDVCDSRTNFTCVHVLQESCMDNLTNVTYVPYLGSPPAILNPEPANNTIIHGTPGSMDINITTNESARCIYSAYAGAGYVSMREFDVTDGTFHQIINVPLRHGSNLFYFWCNDTEGNIDPMPYLLNITFEMWSPAYALTSAYAYTLNPGLALSGSYVNLVWEMCSADSWSMIHGCNSSALMHANSTDGGMTWSNRYATNSSLTPHNPSVAVSDGNTYVVYEPWANYRNPGQIYLHFMNSSDGGKSWSEEYWLMFPYNNSYYDAILGMPDPWYIEEDSPLLHPAIAASGATVHVVWQDRRDESGGIYYKKSVDKGATWVTVQRLVDFLSSYKPSIAASGNSVYVIWEECLNYSRDREGRCVSPSLRYKKSIDGGITWSSSHEFSNNSSGFHNPSIAAEGNEIHAVFEKCEEWASGAEGMVCSSSSVYHKKSGDGGATWTAPFRLWAGTTPSVSLSNGTVQAVWISDYKIYLRKYQAP